MPTGFRPLLRNEAGLTILPTGVIKIRESKTIVDRVLAGENINDPDRAERVHVTINHELVHFYQAVTTAFVFAHCQEILRLSVQFARWLNDKEREFAILAELKDTLIEIENEMRMPKGNTAHDPAGVSVLQLMEAAAVVESLRSIYTTIDLADVLREISTNTDGDATYTHALTVSQEILGADATVRLISTLVFIALNTREPGVTFCAMLRQLSSRDSSEIAALRPQDLIDEFMAERDGSLISSYARGESQSTSRFWKDIGLAFGKSGDPYVLHVVAANPSSILAESNWAELLNDSIKDCMPALVMYEDGRGAAMGLVKHWDDNQITSILAANEILGTMYRLGLDRNYAVLCQQVNCPDRSVALCHMAYPPPPPPDGSWRECDFRSRFKNLTGDWPAEFVRKCDAS